MKRTLMNSLTLILATISMSIASAQNVVSNGTFDADLSDWDNAYGKPASWHDLDADGSASSGSALLGFNSCNGATSLILEQCFGVGEGTEYELSAMTHHLSEQTGLDGSGRLWLKFYDATGCTGGVLADHYTFDSVPDDVWTAIGRTDTTPTGTQSVKLLLGVSCVNDPETPEVDSFSASMDKVSLTFSEPSNLPPAERAALVELYDATNGGAWTEASGWLDAEGTECSWFGVSCNAGQTGVVQLALPGNNLRGTLPSSLADLSGLQTLDLSGNTIVGPIPETFGTFAALTSLNLGSNGLTGSIPAALGSISPLAELILSGNRLSGSIPAAIASPVNLANLQLQSNQLVGEIPVELASLGSLAQLDVGFNALRTDDTTLQAFLAGLDPDWEDTQTAIPADASAGSPTSSSVVVSWTPITYTDDSGGYFVFITPPRPGPAIFTDGFEGGDADWWGLPGSWVRTTDKTDTSVLVDGLASGATYALTVRAITEPHAGNQNQVIGESTGELAASTSSQ